MREDLNRRAQRALAVLRPLKVVIENYPEGQRRADRGVNNPEDPSAGTRQRSRSRASSTSSATTSWRCRRRSSSGCRPAPRSGCATPTSSSASAWSRTPPARSSSCAAPIDPDSLAGATPTRRVKGTIHWVSAAHARDAEVRLYDRLFRSEDPGEDGRDPLTDLNPALARGPCAAARSSRRSRRRCRARGFSSSGRGTSASTPTPAAGRTGLQPHGHAEGQLGEDRQSRDR